MRVGLVGVWVGGMGEWGEDGVGGGGAEHRQGCRVKESG